MEIEGSLLLVGLCPVSAITQEPNENPIALLERLKEALQKFINLDFKSDFKGQIPVPMHIRHQDKVTTAKQQDPAASLDEMVQTATSTFYNRTGEGGQGPGQGEKERDKACPDAGCPPGKPYGKLRVLEMTNLYTGRALGQRVSKL